MNDFAKIISPTQLEFAPKIKNGVLNFNKMPEAELNQAGYFRVADYQAVSPNDAKEYYQDGNVIKARIVKGANYDYAGRRLTEYPSLGDFIDAFFKSLHGDDKELREYCKQRDLIKLKYPKINGEA